MTSKCGQKRFNQFSTERNPFYEQRQKKNETKLRKTEKTWKRKIIQMKATSVKMRYQI